MDTTIEKVRSDLMSMFKEQMRVKEDRLASEEEKLDERARTLTYRETELHDLYSNRRSVRHHLTVLQQALERMMRILHQSVEEQARQDRNMFALKDENEKLTKELEEVKKMHAHSQDDMKSLLQLMNHN